MAPPHALVRLQRQPAPRARGDGPSPDHHNNEQGDCSPRTRGWPPPPRRREDSTHLLPAHAGMAPSRIPATRTTSTAPRARGDGPHEGDHRPQQRPCSPRTRGWSPEGPAPRRGGPLLPAHAGMVPPDRPFRRAPTSAPRARGDGPVHVRRGRHLHRCSPRTRGWSRRSLRSADDRDLLPAHAGMVPSSRSAPARGTAAPRARGDGPKTKKVKVKSKGCSPRTRGWPPAGEWRPPPGALLPAHARMAPTGRRAATSSHCLGRPLLAPGERVGVDRGEERIVLAPPGSRWSGMYPFGVMPD